MHLPLHQLEGFYWVGATGGYARAAAAMPFPITEPAIYQQVRKLERALGVSLVAQARPRRTVLTPEGRLLHEFVTPFFRELPRVADAVRRGAAVRLVVATDGTLARDLLAPAVAELRARLGPVEVRIAERETGQVAAAVLSGEADAGLAVLGGPRADLREEPLFEVRAALAVPAAHALARRREPPAAADLDGVPLAVYEQGNAGREILDRALAAAGLSLRVAAEASTAETLRALVQAGVAPAFLPVVRRGRSRAARRRWTEPGIVFFDAGAIVGFPAIRYGLVLRADRPRHTAVSELRRLLEARARTMAKDGPPE